MKIQCLPVIQFHYKMESGKSPVFGNPFEITRTRWNSSAHQSNENCNGKMPKAVPATFKINRTKYKESYLLESVQTLKMESQKNYMSQPDIDRELLFQFIAYGFVSNDTDDF